MGYLLRKNSLIFLLCCIVFWCWFYLSFILNKAHVEFGLEVSKNNSVEVFWAKEGQGNAKGKRSNIFVHPGSKHYSVILTDLNELAKLRINLASSLGEAKLLYLNIHQDGFLPVYLSGVSGLEKLHPLDQVEKIDLDNSGLRFLSSGNDSGFEFYLQPEKINYSRVKKIAELGIIIVATWLLGICVSSLLIRHRYVLLLLAGAWLLIWVMAVISKHNSHPDEYVHTAATSYYQENWLPPKYDDPAIRNTYSPYGNSRLNYYEIYYLFAGKCQQFVSRLGVAEPINMRFLNVVLFGASLILAVRSPHVRMLAVPFLLSSQIWYVFSYCNSDAFALFICFIAACELSCAGSLFNRYLKTRSTPQLMLSALYLGSLVGLLLLLKKNYYLFSGFAVVFVLIKHVVRSDRDLRKTLTYRLLAVALIGTAVFGARVGVDYYVNGADKGEKLAAVKEATAYYKFKPSTPPDKRRSSISLKEQGVDFDTMVDDLPWFEMTFKSAFGVYGYTTIYGSITYYEMVKALVLALLLFFLLSILLRGGNIDRLLVLAMLLFSVTLVYGCLYHSWTVDFQPQGRYMLAIIPMLSLLYGNSYRFVNQTVMAAGILALYSLSLYSFISYGLAQIPKIVS
jgi:hypothetical protein